MARWMLRFCLSCMATTLATLAVSAEPSQLTGEWTVDVSKLPIPQPPRSVTMRLRDIGDTWNMEIDIVSADGSITRQYCEFHADGSPAEVSGSKDVDYVSVTIPNSRTLVMGTSLAGHWSNTRVLSVSDDGRSMTETITGLGPDGRPRTRANLWSRH